MLNFSIAGCPTGVHGDMFCRAMNRHESSFSHGFKVMIHFFVLCPCSDVRARFHATFFRSLDCAIYLINVQLRIVRVLTAFCKRCLCLATLNEGILNVKGEKNLQHSNSNHFYGAKHKQRVQNAVRILTILSCTLIE
jgi:hypothetical protein